MASSSMYNVNSNEPSIGNYTEALQKVTRQAIMCMASVDRWIESNKHQLIADEQTYKDKYAKACIELKETNDRLKQSQMDLTTTVSLERVMFERQLDELKAEQRTIVDELNTEHARKMRGLELQIESGEIALRASVDERHLVEAALTAAQYRIRECEEYGKLGEEKLRRRDRRIKSLLEANLCAICKVNKRDTMITACRMVIACYDCLDAIKKHAHPNKPLCPACRKPFTRILKCENEL